MGVASKFQVGTQMSVKGFKGSLSEGFIILLFLMFINEQSKSFLFLTFAMNLLDCDIFMFFDQIM